MKKFAIIGCAGYIAPRHLQAIKETGNTLIASLDKSDSVGILDRYFDNVCFFTEFERFDRHIEKLKRAGEKIDYVVICSPNYLHDAHIRFAFRVGADAICEKPLVLNSWNLDSLEEIENETGKKVYTILQLRLHPNAISLKNKIEKEFKGEKYKVDLNYITPRGKWYNYSWKGDVAKSGGLATNIGIHLFDLLIWIFGEVKKLKIISSTPQKIKGYLELEKASVNWFLSIDKKDLPEKTKSKNIQSFRQILINNKEIEFSEGFTELHTKSYEEIFAGRGFRTKDARPSIELTQKIRELILKNKI